MVEESPPAAQGLTVGFLGNMGYQPNVEAAIRLHRIVRTLRSRFDDLHLKIIGRAPTKEILELAGPHVEVTGPVDSIWVHLKQCDLMVFPMTSGAGLQNKLLESMHAGTPVIASTICLDPLGDDIDEVALRADTDEEFLTAIDSLLSAPARRHALGERTKKFVSRFKWEEILPYYENIVLRAVGRS
ncbi:glycosyltransferase family 4 protein [Lentisalinibacter sediminis]|uniref:glycosyltransferase family 4 protein n=1 Tax=Lentisalinibacter sediminis TaxID=2992237 RepID=UPI00386A6388